MTGIEEHAEVGVLALIADPAHQLQDLRRLVERKARFELPADVDAAIGRQLRAEIEGPGDAVHDQLRIEVLFLHDGDRLDGVDADGLDAQILGEEQILGESGDVGAAVLDADELLRPEIGGQAGKLQAVILDQLAQGLAFLAGIAGVGAGMGIEAAELDAFVAHVGQHVHDLMEVVGRFFLVEDVSPAADGESSFHMFLYVISMGEVT